MQLLAKKVQEQSTNLTGGDSGMDHGTEDPSASASHGLEMSELPQLEIPPTQFDSDSDQDGGDASESEVRCFALSG
jgi:hypothetical protein